MTVDFVVPPGTSQPGAPVQRRARLVAFYLPQFHPTPENDRWWGEGFTEWTNVRKARPLFEGHLQPRVPGSLGYYDLRDPGIRLSQARLARDAGIEAFCYWHYWFGNGRRMLDLPFGEVLGSGEPDFPFCLAWANESWSGIWHGAPDRILIEQTYPGPEDYAAHFDAVLPAFRDRRYLRVQGKPVFLVYSPARLPDAAKFVIQWQKLAVAAGLPGLHLVAMSTDLTAACVTSFDATMPYGPRDFLQAAIRRRPLVRAGQRLFNGDKAAAWAERVALPWLPARYDYAALARAAFTALPRSKRYIPCVLAGWDNTPRAARRGVVFENFSPALFRYCLDKALAHVADKPPEHRLVFIKAWNEWAEGNYLEPDEAYGTQLLDVMAEVMATQAARA
jgi:lipopolysaccharide biosynthesis protein